MTLVEQAFSPSGILAKVLNGYSPRQAQIDMAIDVERAISQKSCLIVEAGTGTGKTFAYLIPSLLSEKKVIISTGTKNLQEQLFHKDIPLIRNAMATNTQIALLKGRANYLCIYRLELYVKERGQLDAAMLTDFVKIRTWATSTRSGDIGEIVDVAEDSGIFPFVTSTTDNCLAKDCPNFDDCYLVQARKKAIDADVLVVNHHLFFADMALKDTGFGELIPKADVVIFDEAHQIPDIASEYFGDAFSTKQILDLCSDVIQIYKTTLTDVKQLGRAAEKCQKAAQEFRLLFFYDPERGNWREKYAQPRFQQAFAALKTDLDFLYQVIKLCISRNEAIDNCYDRAVDILAKYDIMANVDIDGMSFWYETTRRHVVLHLTPLSVADKFSDYIAKSEAGWVFTSATLAVNGGFDHFSQQLGLNIAKTKAATLLVDSPFDYQSQSQLIVPRYLPAAQHHSRALALAELAIPLITASKGACFLLFTSYRMLNQVADILAEKIESPLLVQGRMSKGLLLAAFIDNPQAILLATASFWEGVDVRGDKLTCVIIDKLPFASPDDPMLQARCEDVRRRGGDPFAEIQLPQAVIALKQGVGRLIRDVTDQGVMVICDDRLVNRPYGEVFLKSLPMMKRSRDIEQASEFLTSLSE
ncbi:MULTISPECIES: ATP-dependent DNA helicase [unclassified Colwellia]|uniref:ATP-dependent DNA helicase n=1 Tax=unclassified Colwellia TaxID=196834 RepID=UPI0015F57869|nr:MULTISPECIES: ATP-dependent DNA helicase [unclassified Colwellia]MBA6348767.1 ATP-dependent DNA helicase [Colwellia sp. BRX8-9]MBA6353247.1 ATP-dependent DNA helicase [Colwellia sp. BRX9-1]MBA6380138.1 ATP-dependent DNA helicase [Colwellia sp. BRX10-7]MBA6384248.1 ATP-dependent DNA helicase [Colwellia sp. BRX10-9]MBA6387350.1 ATP-dependent DNA helicase [Colwellia sp. BRX10-2]